MATFGFNSIGLSSATSNGGTSWCQIESANTYVASTGDVITSYSAYVAVDGTTAELAAYDLSSSVPQTRIGTAGTIVATASADWQETGVVSHALSNGVEYGVGMGKPGANTLRFHFDSSGTQRSRHTASGTLPASWTENSTSGAKVSMFATYTPGGGGVGNPWYYYAQH